MGVGAAFSRSVWSRPSRSIGGSHASATVSVSASSPGLFVEDVQVARAIEGQASDPAELLPGFARQESAHPVQFLGVGLQPTVLGGEVNDLLGARGKRHQQPGRDGPGFDSPDD